MKLKEYLETLPGILSPSGEGIEGSKGLVGESLSVIEDFLPKFDEFNNKTIKIIKDVEFSEPRITFFDDNTINVDAPSTPKLITVKWKNGDEYNDIFKDIIEIFSITLANGDIHIRCTETSLKNN